MALVCACFLHRKEFDPVRGVPAPPTETGKPGEYWPQLSDTTADFLRQQKSELAPQAKDMMGRRFQVMEDGTDAIDSILLTKIGLSIAAFMILFRRSSTMKLPVVDLEVPARYLQLLIPFALVFLWFRFGFELHGYIDNRVILDSLARESVSKEWDMNPVFSIRRLIRDGGFGDAWFAAFRPNFIMVDGPQPSSIHVFKLIFYAIVIGTSHAVTLALLVQRAQQVGISNHVRVGHGSLAGFAIFLFWKSHSQFHWDGPHPNWMQSVILTSSLALLAVILCRAPATHTDSQLPPSRPTTST